MRYFSAINLALNKDLYFASFNLREFQAVSPTFKEACEDVTSRHGYSSAWTCFALSDVIRRDLVSVYPRVNGPLDRTARILDTTFSPQQKMVNAPVYVMWTSASPRQLDKTWTPNHFVPLVDAPAEDVVVIADENEDENSIESSNKTELTKVM